MDYPQVEITSRAGLRAWLKANHQTSKGLWVVTYKKPSPKHVPWNDVVEEALCFGFIDSLPRKVDAERSMLLVTPRKPKSGWSPKNKRHVEHLIKEGLMTPAGLAAIEAAKKSGSWSMLDTVMEVPPDLTRALAAYPPAATHFAAFPPSARRGILEWILQAKRPDTRAARIEETAKRAQKNERANQWR